VKLRSVICAVQSLRGCCSCFSAQSTARHDGLPLRRSGLYTPAEYHHARASKFSNHNVIYQCTGQCLRGGSSRSKRARSPFVHKINAGNHRPFSGVRGPVQSTSEDELQHSSQPGRSNSISPSVVCNQGASEQHEDYQQADWHPISPDGAQESACLHGSVKRSRRQHTREQQHFYWQEDLAMNVYHHTCALAN